MSDAPVVWVVMDPRGHVIGGVFEHHEDAIVECESRNDHIRETWPEIQGNYCRLQALAYFTDSLAA